MRTARSRSTIRFALLVLGMAAASCTLERPLSTSPTEFDMGPPPRHEQTAPAIDAVVLIAPVRTAPVLEDDGIMYRLLYEDGSRPRAYSLSRWAAEPSALVAARVRNRLAALTRGVVSPAYGVRSDYTLRIELLDFSQYFDAPGRSRALLRARASLLDTQRRTLVAQREFELERPANPDAPGAVKALTDATDSFVEALVSWIAEHVSKRGANT